MLLFKKYIAVLFFRLVFLGAVFTSDGNRGEETAPISLYNDSTIVLYNKRVNLIDSIKLNSIIKTTSYGGLKGSVYNASVAQTDSTPLLTASSISIDTIKLKNGKIRYVALSRDLIDVYGIGGKISYGDYILVESKYKELNGKWKVVDCLNKKYSKKVDFLFYNKKYGDYRGIKIKVVNKK